MPAKPSHFPSTISQRRMGLETRVWMVPEVISPESVSTEVKHGHHDGQEVDHVHSCHQQEVADFVDLQQTDRLEFFFHFFHDEVEAQCINDQEKAAPAAALPAKSGAGQLLGRSGGRW